MAIDAQALALQAGSLAAAMKPLLLKREAVAIAKLVQEHRDGNLTESSMRSGIAEIAALRGVAGDLEASVRQGQAATDREVISTRPGRGYSPYSDSQGR